jgi:hypothetical protein
MMVNMTTDCDLVYKTFTNSSVACGWLIAQDGILRLSNLQAAFIKIQNISYTASKHCGMVVDSVVDIDVAVDKTVSDSCSLNLGIIADPALNCSAKINDMLAVASALVGDTPMLSDTSAMRVGMLVNSTLSFLQSLSIPITGAPSIVTTTIVLPTMLPTANGESTLSLKSSKSSNTFVAAILGGIIGLGVLVAAGILALRHQRRRKREEQRKIDLANLELNDPSMWAEVAVLRGDGKDPTLIAQMTGGDRALFEAKKTSIHSSSVMKSLAGAVAGGVVNPLALDLEARTLGDHTIAIKSDRKTVQGDPRINAAGRFQLHFPSLVSVISKSARTLIPILASDAEKARNSEDSFSSPNTKNSIKTEINPMHTPAGPSPSKPRHNAFISRNSGSRRLSVMNRRRITFGQALARTPGEEIDDAALYASMEATMAGNKAIPGSLQRNGPAVKTISKARYIEQASAFKPMSVAGSRSGGSVPAQQSTARYHR